MIDNDGFYTDYYQVKYKKVPDLTTDTVGGFVIPDGVVVGLKNFRGNGSAPSAYVCLVFAWGNPNEKILAATRGDTVIDYDPRKQFYQITGNGVDVLQIVIVNDTNSQSGVIGGSFEATII